MARRLAKPDNQDSGPEAPLRNAMRHLCAQAAIATALCAIWPVFAANDQASGTPLELSLGTVKETAEGAAVRALVKYGDRVSFEDRLTNADKKIFLETTRTVKFDVTDKGTFGGFSLRYGARAYLIPFAERTLPNGEKALASNSDGLMHIFPVTVGVDADKTFKSRDVLLEAGYVPFKGDSGKSCFKLGGNPAIGFVGQLGHRTRESLTANSDNGGSLRRVKVELLTDFELGCFRERSRTEGKAGSDDKDESILGMFARDLSSIRVIVESRAWRDLVLRETFRYASVGLRVPTGKGAFLDMKREVGRDAPTFAKGAQYGLYLAVQY